MSLPRQPLVVDEDTNTRRKPKCERTPYVRYEQEQGKERCEYWPKDLFHATWCSKSIQYEEAPK